MRERQGEVAGGLEQLLMRYCSVDWEQAAPPMSSSAMVYSQRRRGLWLEGGCCWQVHTAVANVLA